MVPNEELVRKAVITTDAIAAAGKLNPAQSDKFIDYVIQETVLKDNARIIRFRNEQLEIDKIGIGKRAALPKAEAQDPTLRRGVTTSKVVLQPREIIVPFEIGDIFKEINVEGDSVEEHVIKMMATQLANDLEELYINGQTQGPAALESDLKDGGDSTRYILDSYLSLADGWLRLGDSAHVVDMNGANIGLSTFSAMIRALPTKFRRNKKNLRFYMSPDLAQLYVEKLSTRATILGDRATEGELNTPFGIQLVEVPLMHLLPTIVEHIVLNGTVVTALRYKGVASVSVFDSALAAAPTVPFVGGGTDYTLDAVNGTIARVGGGAITDGETVKVTYAAAPQVLLTHMMNFIVGIGRDIRIEKDRDIYKGVNQYAITAKVAVNFEEVDALSKAINLGQSV